MKGLLSVFFCAFSLMASETLLNQDWVQKSNLWHPATDKLGSTIDTNQGFYKDSSLNVKFTITKKTTKEWPYVELIFAAPQNLEGTQGMTLKYKCDQDLIVKLFQDDFGSKPAGNETYSLYQYVIPKATDWKSIKLDFSKFTFPTWVPPESKSIEMNLKKTQKVYFTPKLDATKGGDSRLQIRSLEFIKK